MPSNPGALVLIATAYHGPALPNGFERPVWVAEEADGRRKRRKTDPAPTPSATVSPHIRLVHKPPAPVVTPSLPHSPPHTHPAVASNGHMAPPPAPSNAPSNAPLQNVPAQNVRAGGGHFYPTHKAVPWDNSNMFSQFQLPATANGSAGTVSAVNGSSASAAGTTRAPARSPPSSSRISVPVTIPPPSPPVLMTAPSAYATTVVPAKRDLPADAGSLERSPKRPAVNTRTD